MSANVANDHVAALYRAIRYFGSQRKLAKHLHVTHAAIYNWLYCSDKIPLHYAEWISRLTDGAISRYELAPYTQFLDSVKPVKPKKQKS